VPLTRHHEGRGPVGGGGDTGRGRTVSGADDFLAVEEVDAEVTNGQEDDEEKDERDCGVRRSKAVRTGKSATDRQGSLRTDVREAQICTRTAFACSPYRRPFQLLKS
jgi:hypothetical protein